MQNSINSGYSVIVTSDALLQETDRGLADSGRLMVLDVSLIVF